MSTDLDKLLSKHEETTNQYLKVFEEELGCKFEILSKINDQLVMILTRDTKKPTIFYFEEYGKPSRAQILDYQKHGCNVFFVDRLYKQELRFALRIIKPYFHKARDCHIFYGNSDYKHNYDCLYICVDYERYSHFKHFYDFRKGTFLDMHCTNEPGRPKKYYTFDVDVFKETGKLELVEQVEK